MDGTNPSPPARQKCKAKSRSGSQCKNWPLPGAVVCRSHGGAAPQVQRKARLRLLELVDPAISTLAREMATATKSADKQRAANSILDRAGYGRSQSVEISDARALLLERLVAMKEEHDATQAQHRATTGGQG